MILFAGALLGAPAGPGREAAAVEAVLTAAGADADTLRYYDDRPGHQIWIRDGRTTPAAERLVVTLSRADGIVVEGQPYLTPELRAAWGLAGSGQGDRALHARLDAMLSAAFVRRAGDLRRSSKESGMLVVDPAAVRAPAPASELLAAVDSDRSGAKGAEAVEAALGMHAEHEALAASLDAWRAAWAGLPTINLPHGPTIYPGERDGRIAHLGMRLGGRSSSSTASDRLDQDLAGRLAAFQTWHGLEPTGALEDATVDALNRPSVFYEGLILKNLDRLRVLPKTPGRRYVKVNIASGELSAVAKGEEMRRMRVVTGRPGTPTPELAGIIRYAVLTPYWNIPEDLVRKQIAPNVRRGGRAAFEARGLEALSDWSPSAKRLDPMEIDWAAVEAGRTRVRLRQTPGPRNMMGKAKFMLPNDVGIYLHDTPDKALFRHAKRWFSAGCVRVEDAEWLGLWLLGENIDLLASGKAEQRADLMEPVPVYLLYQTVEPRSDGGLVFHPDPYCRDFQGRTRSGGLGARAG